MSESVLSQEEVDALLNDRTNAPAKPSPSEKAGTRAYSLGRQERIIRGRMPTFESINERFARNFRNGLFNLLGRGAEISVEPVQIIKYSDFVRHLSVPSNLNLVHIKPLRGAALFVFDPELVYLVIDNLFGGDGRFHSRVEGRDFTATEQRVIHRLLDIAFEEYRKAWHPIFTLEFDYIRSEMHTQFANITGPSELVVAVAFKIELGAGGGRFQICLPYSMIEPIRELLYSSLQAAHNETDGRWLALLSKSVQAAEVELIATLASTTLTLEEVLHLKAGDMIAVDIAETIVAEVSGVPVLECQYGMQKNRYALRVERLLADAEQIVGVAENLGGGNG